MAEAKVAGDTFLARCGRCGKWLEVEPTPGRADSFFAYLQVVFTCCGEEQTAVFTLEKDVDDVH